MEQPDLNQPRLQINEREAAWLKAKKYLSKLPKDGEEIIRKSKGKYKVFTETYYIETGKRKNKEGTRFFIENIPLEGYKFDFFYSQPRNTSDDCKIAFVLYDDDRKRAFMVSGTSL